ncbi:MAG: glycogen-binding domain-containing protein [Gemmatimonadales bacterium]
MSLLGSSTWGVGVRLGTERALDLAGAPTFGVLQMATWRRMGDVTLHFNVSSHAARFSNMRISDQPSDGWVDSSGYRVQRADTIQQSQDLRLRAWSQVETAVTWKRGRLQWDAAVEVRPPVAGLPFAVWGQVATTLRLFRRLSVIAEVGSLPAQVALSVPSARFVHLGIQINPFDASRDERTPATERAVLFSVLPSGTQQCTITLRDASAKTVEVAGDFDGWHPISLSRTNPGIWQVTVGLRERTYHVNVRIDGGPWMAPPGTVTVTDDFGGTVGLVQGC